jgi:tetratricopeptide (TPR) repeat protein
MLAGLSLSDLTVARARVVDTGQSQCCSSINPQLPPATYYGATFFRSDDPGVLDRPFVAPLEDPPAGIDELERAVSDVEGKRGPLAPELVSPLRSLASAYLAEKRYPQAISTLRRGIHLARMNYGLHTTAQVDMLEQLIGAHIRQGDFASADFQQDYLYRVISYRRDHRSPEMREATLRYANWMRGAYLGDLDSQRFPRLVGINDLYEKAIEEIEEHEGAYSRELLPYLKGRAQLSYLISVYPGENPAGIRAEDQQMSQFELPGEAMLRFWRMRDHNFRYGLEALERRVEIFDEDPASTPTERAEARIALADWYQWNRRYARAISLYEEAWGLVEGSTGEESWLSAVLGEPLELPRETVFSPGVVPLGTHYDAEVAIRFDVSRHGEAKDITILSEKTRETQPGITRAYHYLRNVRFRPVVRAGTVVRAEDVERNYQIRY